MVKKQNKTKPVGSWAGEELDQLVPWEWAKIKRLSVAMQPFFCNCRCIRTQSRVSALAAQKAPPAHTSTPKHPVVHFVTGT